MKFKEVEEDRMNKEEQYRALQKKNDGVANEIRRLKFENEDAKKKLVDLEQVLTDQNREIEEKIKEKKKLGKRKRFGCF